MIESSAEPGRTSDAAADQPDVGSAWWAEVLFGAVCCTAAAGIALANTAFGPFAHVTVVYGFAGSVLYVLFAVTLGLTFLRWGLRASPYVSEVDPRSDEPSSNEVAVPVGNNDV